MNQLEQQLAARLHARADTDSLRNLTVKDGHIDLSSNDYLGFARSEKLYQRVDAYLKTLPKIQLGATGSRLLTGNSELYDELEQQIAEFHHAESALVFNSGYDANLGLLSTLPKRGDTLLYDELCHASIRDGVRLGFARSASFRHNDLNDLEDKLKNASGNIFVVVESLYSMDGDIAPLHELATFCEEKGANLIVDEAHAGGVYGPDGRGLVSDLGLEEKVFARIYTFGKALGVHGAAVLGTKTLRQYLINFCRSFIYTTALPRHSVAAIRCAYVELLEAEYERRHLKKLVSLFNEKAKAFGAMIPERKSQIQNILIPGNSAVRKLSVRLADASLDLRPILSPTVPAGSERLRVCLHSFNSESDIERLFEVLDASAVITSIKAA